MPTDRHWAVYYQRRQSRISDNLIDDEIAPQRRLSTQTNDLGKLSAEARTNAPTHATHFRIAKARERAGRHGNQFLTELLPCR